jgi:hypothetical protein
MKSTLATRQSLRQRLIIALRDNPKSQELQEALDIVDDMLRYHKKINDKQSLYIVSDGEEIFLFDPVNMDSHGSFEWDGSTEDLGIIIEGFIT